MEEVDNVHDMFNPSVCGTQPSPRPCGLRSCYLEGDFSRHGEAVSDDGLFFRGATLPAIQFNAAAPRQENLLVHLD